jgi:hypothetical protein
MLGKNHGPIPSGIQAESTDIHRDVMKCHKSKKNTKEWGPRWPSGLTRFDRSARFLDREEGGSNPTRVLAKMEA